MEWLFWLSIGALAYSVLGYPLLVHALSLFVRRRAPVPPATPMKVTFLIPAHNEAAVIADKIRNTFALSNSGGHEVDIVLVSDGSTDGTVEIARAFDDPRLVVLETEGHAGKLSAMNMAMGHCHGDVVVFSDANGILAPKTLDALMRHFGDAKVGGVCGRIGVAKKSRRALGLGEHIFWVYDQGLKLAESALSSAVSAQGSIYAVRRELCRRLEPGCADDFVMSVGVIHAGKRLVFEPEAFTEEHVTDKAGREIDRRIRSTEMGWRGLMQNASLMNPFRHGLYAWQLFSHKLVRRLNPVFMILVFAANTGLVGTHWGYDVTMIAQTGIYGLAVAGALSPAIRRLPGVGAVTFLVMANAAMALGILAYLRGRKSSRWTPVREG